MSARRSSTAAPEMIAGPFDGVSAPALLSVEEAITTTLRDAIRRGEFRPGERLPQERLAEQLHVSRIPLRDALRRLEAERLVTIDRRRGAEVVALATADVIEVYEILIIVEQVAVRRAVLGLDDEAAERLAKMSARMEKLLGDPVAVSETRRAFYADLFLHAKRSRMTMTIMRLRDSVQRYHVRPCADAEHHDHTPLRRAIAARDADAAVKTHLAHLRHVRDDLVGMLAEEHSEHLADRPIEAGRAMESSGETAPVARSPSVEETATSALRNMILRGDVLPGSRLLQDQLAATFGVSRIPLRDALRRLEVEGLVRIDPRRGAYVTELSAADVQEIYELREILEPRCVRHAIRALDDAGVAEMIAMSQAMDRPALTPADGRAQRRAFYASLYARARKPRMLELILRLRDDVHRYHVLTSISESRDAHDELRERIRDRDADGAAQLIAKHLRGARNDLIQVLARQQAEGG